MANRGTFRVAFAVTVGTLASMALVRLWAMRHAGEDGAVGTIADAVNISV